MINFKNIKRFSIISCLIFLAVFFYSTRRLKPVEIIPVMALPVSNKVIILDAGHGTPDEGAESNSGVLEAPINLQITLKVQKLLESSGSTVILTRSDDNSIYDWGSNSYGELGLGDDIDRNIPTKVNGLTGVIKDIFANGAQVYLLMDDDSIYSWGDVDIVNMLGREGVNNEPLKISFIK